MNCWEFQKCGREIGGAKAAQRGVCPAYPDNGRSCATTAGTFCQGVVQGSVAMKMSTCRRCDFFNSEHYLRIPTIVVGEK